MKRQPSDVGVSPNSILSQETQIYPNSRGVESNLKTLVVIIFALNTLPAWASGAACFESVFSRVRGHFQTPRQGQVSAGDYVEVETAQNVQTWGVVVRETSDGNFYDVWVGQQSVVQRIPKSKVSNFRIGNEARLGKALQEILNEPTALDIHQSVKFRDSTGAIQPGKVKNLSDDQVQIEYAQGVLTLNRKEVFPAVSGKPPKRLVSEAGIDSEELLQDPLVRDFFNSAAKMSSRPEFGAMAEVDQVKFLKGFLDEFVDSHYALAKSPLGDANMKDILCMGAGVCRHKSPILARMLAEAGYDLRVIVNRPVFGTPHMWIELDFGNPVVTFVVDPTTGAFKPLKDFQEASGALGEVSRQYVDPHRKVTLRSR